MAKFGVIVCPKCQRAKGVNLESKTTKCPNCNKHLTISKLKVFHETNSEQDLVAAVGKVNVTLSNGLSGYEDAIAELESKKTIITDLTPYKRIAMKVNDIKNLHNKFETIAIHLNNELGEFSDNDFKKVLEELGASDIDIDAEIKKLLNKNTIYEPKLGKYKIVG